MAAIVVLMGPTGAGKSVQAALLAEQPEWVHVSTGELLRADPETKRYLESGRLVSDDMTKRVLAGAVRGLPPGQTMVLDGFPRTLGQAKWLDQQLVLWQRQLRGVILLEVSQETSGRRLAGRGRSDDGAEAQALKWRTYHQTTAPVIEYYER